MSSRVEIELVRVAPCESVNLDMTRERAMFLKCKVLHWTNMFTDPGRCMQQTGNHDRTWKENEI
jgi:hypothetical protein